MERERLTIIYVVLRRKKSMNSLASMTEITPHCWKLGALMTLLPQVKLLRMQLGWQ